MKTDNAEDWEYTDDNLFRQKPLKPRDPKIIETDGITNRMFAIMIALGSFVAFLCWYFIK